MFCFKTNDGYLLMLHKGDREKFAEHFNYYLKQVDGESSTCWEWTDDYKDVGRNILGDKQKGVRLYFIPEKAMTAKTKHVPMLGTCYLYRGAATCLYNDGEHYGERTILDPIYYRSETLSKYIIEWMQNPAAKSKAGELKDTKLKDYLTGGSGGYEPIVGMFNEDLTDYKVKQLSEADLETTFGNLPRYNLI